MEYNIVLVLFATKRKPVAMIVRSSARVGVVLGVVVVVDIAAVDAPSTSRPLMRRRRRGCRYIDLEDDVLILRLLVYRRG
jgi:hypothetical protein